ncbi:MAG: hypothetical protein IH614_10885 [Desulfuromonadales bacterium]|nr:hypothetical protein [Desulfuromonadales bacterium]
MGKSDRILPPGPNPREDLRKEKDDRPLRDYLRQQAAEQGANAVPEHQAADQAEGDRELREEEIKRQEEGEQR